MKKIIVSLMPGNGPNFWGWYLSHWYMTNSGIDYSPKSKTNVSWRVSLRWLLEQ